MPAVTMPKDHPATEGVTLSDGQEVKPGQTVEVSDALADALADQGWTKHAAKKAAKKDAPTSGDDAAEAADTKEKP